MKKLIAGNWKMNGSIAAAASLTDSIIQNIQKNKDVLNQCDFLVCPPSIHIDAVFEAIDENAHLLSVGAQDCSRYEAGAYTSDISAGMLKDIGCTHVILGHSERRQYHGEGDELIAAKAQTANSHGLTAIICVGETEEQREQGIEQDVVGAQLSKAIPAGANAHNTVIAYEPVWAIGTGKTATVEDVRAMHQYIRDKLKENLADFSQIRILYGGSVKPSNAEELMSVDNVDGALIGGASLKADDFIAIAQAAPKR